MAPTLDPIIPSYRIDLSLPPAQRYTSLAADFAHRMKEITPLFDTILAEIIPWLFLRRVAKYAVVVLFRRLHSSEESDEIRGIAKASGVHLYILVALNVFLDSFLGCTSGGVMTRVQARTRPQGVYPTESVTDQNKRMLHFRTLDWGMSELRSLLVVLEFVRSQSDEPDKVIGRSITYAGFTGMLTGVRENLSISLNFRPTHDCSTRSLRIHQVMVLLGMRPSIASILRHNFLHPERHGFVIDDMAEVVMKARATPCYVILSSGQKTSVIQKDLFNGVSRSATDFIVQTNHDNKPVGYRAHGQDDTRVVLGMGMEEILEDSENRSSCVQRKWESLVRRRLRQEDHFPAVSEQTLQKWVKAFPTMNECTHFGCILDPGTGTVRWLERGDEHV